MAGMLPGVEAARRRRFHNNTDDNNESRRRPSSFCLYATTTSYSNPTFREESRKRCCDERLEQRLGAAATDAKKRLDHRLLLRPKNNESDLGNLKRSGSKRLIGWWKLVIIRWRSRWRGEEEEEECAVCLEGLHHHNEHLRGEIVIMELPCAHRFHTNCLLPWLQAQPHCPCCRLQLPSS